MSDPMTNSEVEDVLSSIRRLVSDEKRTEPTVAQQSGKVADRLVLTPSLRVSGAIKAGDDPAEGDDAETVPGDILGVEKDSVSDVPSSMPLLLDSALDVSGSSGDTDLSDAAENLGVDSVEFKRREHSDFGEGTSEAADGIPDTLGAKIAALETLIADRAEEWEPDQAGAGPNAGTELPAMDWAKTDKCETTVDTAEPVASDRAFVRVDGPAETSDAGADAIAPGTLTDDLTLDQDALRILVSEIVRQELQGALGERITRNVRKLVRRELHRALTSKDLE